MCIYIYILYTHYSLLYTTELTDLIVIIISSLPAILDAQHCMLSLLTARTSSDHWLYRLHLLLLYHHHRFRQKPVNSNKIVALPDNIFSAFVCCYTCTRNRIKTTVTIIIVLCNMKFTVLIYVYIVT